jgi:hypothetical protein
MTRRSRITDGQPDPERAGPWVHSILMGTNRDEGIPRRTPMDSVNGMYADEGRMTEVTYRRRVDS